VKETQNRGVENRKELRLLTAILFYLSGALEGYRAAAPSVFASSLVLNFWNFPDVFSDHVCENMRLSLDISIVLVRPTPGLLFPEQSPQISYSRLRIRPPKRRVLRTVALQIFT